jgi:hypothetical protein
MQELLQFEKTPESDLVILNVALETDVLLLVWETEVDANHEVLTAGGFWAVVCNRDVGNLVELHLLKGK